MLQSSGGLGLGLGVGQTMQVLRRGQHITYPLLEGSIESVRASLMTTTDADRVLDKAWTAALALANLVSKAYNAETA